MARVLYIDVATDRSGNIIQNAAVFLYQPGTTTAPLGTMYTTATGGTVQTNPLISDAGGLVKAWLDTTQLLDVKLTDNSNAAYYPTTPGSPLDFPDYTRPSVAGDPAHATKTPGAHAASAISFSPTGSIAGTNMQTALAEVASELAVLAPPTLNVRYAHPAGDDANDGLTWSTAKETVMGAYDALDANGGTVYIAAPRETGISIGAPGIWTAGSWGSPVPWYSGETLDPALVSAGWRKPKFVKFIGVGGNDWFGNGIYGGATKIIPTGDGLAPIIQIANSFHPMVFENLYIPGIGQSMKLGFTPYGEGANGNTAMVSFHNCHFAVGQTLGMGPCIEMGYAFWINFHHCIFQGNAGTAQITAVANTTGTYYRYTTNVAHQMSVGDTVQIRGMSPDGYNSGLSTFTVLNSAGPTSFDVDLLGVHPGAATFSGDEVANPIRTHRRAAITMTDQTAASSSGYVTIEGGTFNSGGVRYRTGINGANGAISMQNVTLEGDFTNPEPPLFDALYMSDLGEAFTLIGLGVADATAESPAIQVAEGTNPRMITVIDSGYVRGPATVLGGKTQQFRRRQVVEEGQVGFAENRIYGQHDSSRRQFGPATVRAVNLATQDPSGWVNGAATLTTGQPGPAGIANAGMLSTASATQQTQNAADITFTTATGDWIVAGVWARQSSTTVETGNIALAMSVFTTGMGVVFGVTYPHNGSGWEWIAGGAKVTGGSTVLRQTLYCVNTHTMVYYAPCLHVIPAGTMTDPEAREYINHLQTTPPGTVVGDVALLKNQGLSLDGVRWLTGTGTPEGSVTAPVGSLYTNRTGGASTTLYVKQSGSGNTGWAAK